METMIMQVSGRESIGDALRSAEDSLSAGESLSLTLKNGDRWVGSLTLEQETDDLCHVSGRIFDGQGDDRGIALTFDMIQGVPGAFFPVEESPQPSNQEVIADVYGAGGMKWNRENAPGVKPFSASAENRALFKGAQAALSHWLKDKPCSECVGTGVCRAERCRKCQGKGRTTNQALRDRMFPKPEPKAPETRPNVISREVKARFGVMVRR